MPELKRLQQLHQLYMQAPIAIGIYVGEKHIIEFANAAMLDLWEKTAEQVMNKPLFEALPEASAQGFEEILSGVLHTGEPFSGKELPVTLHRKGKLELTYFNILYEPLYNDEGKVYGITQTATEVTELVEARQQAERNEEIIKTALEAARMGTWHMDFVQGTIDTTVEYDRIFGYQKEPLKPWNMAAILEHIVPEDRQRAEESYQRGLQQGTYNCEVRVLWPDQSLHHVQIKGKTAYNMKGDPTGMSGTIMDTTEQKLTAEKERQLAAEQAARKEAERSEEELFRLTRELAASNKEIQVRLAELSRTNDQLTRTNADLDNFVYTASHDLKAPISNIEGLVETLNRARNGNTLNAPLFQKIVGMIQSSIERFKRTTGELTDIARIQKEEQETSELIPADIIQEVLLDLQPSIEKSSAEIVINDCVGLTFHFSYKNFKSVVYNLISNAIKYRALDRPPIIEVQCYRQGSQFLLVVKDNGLGISEQDKQKIFMMFKRVHAHVEGSGVGLYLVKRITDNAGGKIEVESQEGKGSTFSIYLPTIS